MQRRVVREEPMLVLIVLAESLAMVCDQDNDRPVEKRPRFQVRQHLAEHRVHVRDLAVVRTRCVSFSKGRGRCVWRMRFEQVDPREESAPACTIEPGTSLLPRFLAGSLNTSHGAEISGGY